MKRQLLLLLFTMLLCSNSSKAAYFNTIEIWNGEVVGTHWVEIYGTSDSNYNFTVGNGGAAIMPLYAYGTVDLNNVYMYEGFGRILPVIKINDYAFSGLTGITSVIIPSSVVSIGEKAFRGSGITAISIPASVTKIANSTFSRCSSLASVEIANGITSIGDNAFEYCGKLSSVQFPSSINYIGKYAFSYNTSLINVEIPSGVSCLNEGCFAGCTNLESITIPSNMTTIGANAFEDCKSLKDINSIDQLTSIGDGAFKNCTSLTSITIPNGVTTISKEMFSGCTGLKSIIIPESVTSIEDKAFYGCTGLTSITIPSSVKSIGNKAFYGCTGLTSITIPSSVESIGSSAFEECSGIQKVIVPDIAKWCEISFASNTANPLYYTKHLYSDDNTEVTELVIPEGTTKISDYAFVGCYSITSVTISESVTTIGGSAFQDCTALTNVLLNSNAIASKTYSISSSLKSIFGTQVETYILGDGISTIGSYAFYGCTGLTSITIPSGVTSIGNYVFSGCTELNTVTINSNDIMSIYYTSSSSLSSVFGSQVKEYIIGEGITSIGGNAFYNCRNMTSVNLPNSLTDIGYSAFYGCSSLNAITIPDNATNISYNAFEGCAGLTSIVVGAGNTMYDSRENCNALIRTSTNTLMRGCQATTIPANVTSIYSSAFSNCVGLSSIDIPESVISIGDNAFNGCADLSTAILPNNIRTIASSSFPNKTKLYVNTGTQTLLNLWKNNYANVYETGTDNLLPAPFLSALSTTQTTAKVKINNKYEGYNYMYDSKLIYDDTFVATGFSPASSNTITVSVSYAGISYSASVTAKTIGIYPTVIGGATSASSIFANGAYTSGDAVFVKEVFKCNGKEVEGKSISVNGLNPNTSYNVEYTITVAYGDNNQYTTSFTGSKSVKTNSLTLTTEQPKVVSMGNVIVSATTNVDPEEKNVGFEWRREDWSSTFASQSGAAVVLDGTMEGYIRNLYTGKLWNYRAYYLSDSGTYYYGEWVGIDPTNTSYFEPTVHTYADISTSGKVALIRGYVLNGTDKITVQGFKYWKTANKGNSLDIAMEGEPQAAVVSVPADAITETVDIVGAGQQMMNATLKDLDYGSTYQCVAFATTSENETFYGEVQSFTTEADPTGIEGVKEDAGSSKPVTVVACYDINGKRLSQPQKGLNILRMSDGTTRKVVR